MYAFTYDILPSTKQLYINNNNNIINVETLTNNYTTSLKNIVFLHLVTIIFVSANEYRKLHNNNNMYTSVRNLTILIMINP